MTATLHVNTQSEAGFSMGGAKCFKRNKEVAFANAQQGVPAPRLLTRLTRPDSLALLGLMEVTRGRR